jgi:hypothetical protein
LQPLFPRSAFLCPSLSRPARSSAFCSSMLTAELRMH